MTGKRRRQRTPRFLRHRTLIAAEAVLLVGLAKDQVSGLVMASQLQNWAKVLFVMGSTIGILGGMFLVLGRIAQHGVSTTHDAVKVVPLPMPTLLVHAAAFAGLFVLYARILGLQVW
jgi:hypothetical protein